MSYHNLRSFGSGDSGPHREEHLLPLMVVAGAAGSDMGRRTYNEKVMGMAISAFQFAG